MLQGLKELLKKFGVENDEAAQAVDSFIAETVSEKTANMIPKHRFDAINEAKKEAMKEAEELRAKADALATQAAEAKKLAAGASELQEKYSTLQAQIDAEQLSQWEKLSSFFNTKEGDPTHVKASKAKGLFVWAEEGKKLTPQQVQENLSRAKPLIETGYFESPQGADVNGARPGGAGTATEKPIIEWPA